MARALRRDDTGVDADGIQTTEQARVLNFHAAVLNHFETRIARFLRGFFMHNTKLQPDDFGPYFNCLIDKRGTRSIR